MSATQSLSAKQNVPDAVLHSALYLFTHKGYFNTSVPDIVKHSGCSTGSIYHHFSDKKGIAEALYQKLVERMETALADIEKNCDTTKQRCHEIIKLLFHLTENEPETMRFMLFSKHREIIDNIAPICSTKPFVTMLEIVTTGMELGEVENMDAMVAVSVMFGAALRMIQLRLDGIINDSITNKQDDVFFYSWRAVKKQ